MNKNLIIYLIIFTSIISIKCEKSAEPASFLSIDSFVFCINDHDSSTDCTVECSNHESNITDAWVTMDGLTLGAFELPAQIPILNEGEHNFRISPGIKENGISATRIIYPFYKIHESSINIVLNEHTIILPTTNHEDGNYIFENVGTFDDGLGGNMLEETENSNVTSFGIQNINVFQGQNSFEVCIDSAHHSFHIQSIEDFNIEDFKFLIPEHVFLEIHFKSSIPFKIGLIKTTGNEELKMEKIELYSSIHWKKIYINLSSLIIPNINNSSFQIYFESGGDMEAGGCVYLDNIKIAH